MGCGNRLPELIWVWPKNELGVKVSRQPCCWQGAVSGFRERIERIQARIKWLNLAWGVIIRSIRYRDPLTAFPSQLVLARPNIKKVENEAQSK
jgi:hypothetical protein